MASSWLQAQLKVAEGLLDAVDKTVSKNLSTGIDPLDHAAAPSNGPVSRSNSQANVHPPPLPGRSGPPAGPPSSAARPSGAQPSLQQSVPRPPTPSSEGPRPTWHTPSASSAPQPSCASQELPLSRSSHSSRATSSTGADDAWAYRPSAAAPGPAEAPHGHSAAQTSGTGFTSSAPHPGAVSHEFAAATAYTTAPFSALPFSPAAASAQQQPQQQQQPHASPAGGPARSTGYSHAAGPGPFPGDTFTSSSSTCGHSRDPSDAAPHAAASTSSTAADSAAAAVSPAAAAAAAAATVAPPPAGREAQQRRRVDQLKSENEQLEDMLHKAEQRAAAEAARAEQLAAELRSASDNRTFSEGTLQQQLAAQQATVREVAAGAEAARRSAEAAQRATVRLEAQVCALQESNALLLQSKADVEGGMLEALKAELAAAEQRMAAEQRAHAATRSAAASRERDLQQHLEDSSAAFAGAQRSLEESTARGRELEEQLALLDSARCELADQLHRSASSSANLAGAAAGGGSVGASQGGDASNRQLQVDALGAELQVQRRAVVAAQAGRAAAEARLADTLRELEGLRETLAGRKDTTALEGQLHEVSDMLLIKQSQLERLSGDRAAQQLRLERELHLARDEATRLRSAAAAGGGSHAVVTLGGGGPARTDMVPMDTLGEPYRRLTRHRRVGRAVTVAGNLLDSTAATAAFFLRQYPLGRLAVFGYLLLVHLWMYLLIGSMQRQALSMEGGVPGRAA